MRTIVTVMATLMLGWTLGTPHAIAATAGLEASEGAKQKPLLGAEGAAGKLTASLESRVSAEQVSAIPVDASGASAWIEMVQGQDTEVQQRKAKQGQNSKSEANG